MIFLPVSGLINKIVLEMCIKVQENIDFFHIILISTFVNQ